MQNLDGSVVADYMDNLNKSTVLDYSTEILFPVVNDLTGDPTKLNLTKTMIDVFK